MIVGCAEECDLESAITGNNRGVDDRGSQERGVYESDGVDIVLPFHIAGTLAAQTISVAGGLGPKIA